MLYRDGFNELIWNKSGLKKWQEFPAKFGEQLRKNRNILLLFLCSVWVKTRADKIISVAAETRENVLNVFECV